MVKRLTCKRLHRKIDAILSGRDLATKLEVLLNVITLEVAQLCPQCRQHIGAALIRRLPLLLAEAEEFAAENPNPTHASVH